MEHEYETHTHCEKAHCIICDGGLANCVVCGQAEAELEDTCPGPKQSQVSTPLINWRTT